MNVTVYCGSMLGNDPAYREAAEELGRWLAGNGHTLVYGGGGVGLMGAVSDAALAAGGRVIGIIPEFLAQTEASRSGLSELAVTQTMAERKAKMIALGDAYVALPGGPGTIEEISEVVSQEKLGLTDGPCALLNVSGYYDELAAAYDKQLAGGFATPAQRALLHVVSSVAELAALL